MASQFLWAPVYRQFQVMMLPQLFQSSQFISQSLQSTKRNSRVCCKLLWKVLEIYCFESVHWANKYKICVFSYKICPMAQKSSDQYQQYSSALCMLGCKRTEMILYTILIVTSELSSNFLSSTLKRTQQTRICTVLPLMKKSIT